MPNSVQIELTNHCNYRCGFCPQAYYRNKDYQETPFDRKKGYMDFSLFQEAVRQCKRHAQEINFSFFGEPTLHPEYLKIFKWLKENKGSLRIVMNSNLSMVTEGIFNAWIDTGVNQCRFSIDAARSLTYNEVRPGGPPKDLKGESADRQHRLNTIENKVRWWFKNPRHVPTRHVFVVCEKNKNEIGEFVRKWEPLLGPNDEILVKNVLTYGGVINKDTPEFQKLTHTNQCNVWEQDSLTIDWQGNVTPCNLDVNMALTIGNIKDNTLGELDRNVKWRELRAKSKRREISPCNTCHDANNWTNNVIIKKGDVWRQEYRDKFNENRPKYVPRLGVGK